MNSLLVSAFHRIKNQRSKVLYWRKWEENKFTYKFIWYAIEQENPFESSLQGF